MKYTILLAGLLCASTAYAGPDRTQTPLECARKPIVSETTGKVLYYNRADPYCGLVKDDEGNIVRQERQELVDRLRSREACQSKES